MTITIDDDDEPGGGKAHDDHLLPARRGDASVVARKRRTLPEVMPSAIARFLCELTAFGVAFAVVRLAAGATLQITISGYIPLWPALPLLLIWKAINRLLKP
jgi:hypothetical protein